MTRGFLLLDANVLVDYQSSDLSVLTLVSQHIGNVHIATTVLAEVDGLSESECEQLGLHIVEPTLPQLIEAEGGRTRLSFEDRTCLLMSRDNGWICVTNDKALRRSCTAIDVDVRWGLELMHQLVEQKQLSKQEALATARAMCSANPLFLGAKVLALFEEKLARLR